MLRAAIVSVLVLTACDLGTESEPTTLIGKPAPCEVVACRHVAECSPVQTGGVDWTTTERCLASDWECYDEAACLDAVAALPCLSDPPTWEEIEANTRAFVAVRASCIGPPYLPPEPRQ